MFKLYSFGGTPKCFFEVPAEICLVVKTRHCHNFIYGNEIDSVIVFGYTNDSWTNVSFGNEKYSNFKKEDLLEFCPAVCYLAAKIKEVLPNANVLWLLNTDVDEKFPKAVKAIATHFEQKYLHFEDIDKLSGHPSVKGMKQIAEAIKNL